MLRLETRRIQDLRGRGVQGSYLSQAFLPGVHVAPGDFAGADKEITSFPHARNVAPNAASFGVLLGLRPKHLCAPASADNREMLLTFLLPAHRKARARLGPPGGPESYLART